MTDVEAKKKLFKEKPIYRFISTHFGTVTCPCFPLINHYFYKKLSLYIHIPKFIWDWDLNLNLDRKEMVI